MQDGESMKDNICGMMAEALNKKDMTSAKAKFDTNGKICLLLNEKRQKGEKIESGEMTIRIKPVMHIPADTRSAFPVISVQSPVSIQCCWQS